MGKLVWFLADGTTLDIPLDRERVTVGRQPGNDVCLPYPAVSGEHAAFIPLSTGAVVEDLASTNGTFVNGDRASRQILHDGDRIDIGGQRLLYVNDVHAVVAGIDRGRTRADPRFHDVSEIQTLSLTVAAAVAPEALIALETEMEAGPDSYATAAGAAAINGSPTLWSGVKSEMGQVPREAAIDLGCMIDPMPVARRPTAKASGGPAGVLRPDCSIKVVTGPNVGRTLPLIKDESLIGRVGNQVAAVRRAGEGFCLVPVEGAEPPRVNGVAVHPDGIGLQAGDVMQVAGVELEFIAQDGGAPG